MSISVATVLRRASAETVFDAIDFETRTPNVQYRVNVAYPTAFYRSAGGDFGFQ